MKKKNNWKQWVVFTASVPFMLMAGIGMYVVVKTEDLLKRLNKNPEHRSGENGST